jgi:hypothetical protein
VDATEIQEAFRRGIRGASASGELTRDEVGGAAGGANEALLLALKRMPGLSHERAAYETGRALRMIIRLFDQAGAPEVVGRQFIDNLGAAVMSEHMRRPSVAWGAADTADMFVEMYARVLGAPRSELDKVRRRVMDYAVAETPQAHAGGGLGALFKRRRSVAAGS